METISALIQGCDWFPSRYLIISDNAFSPLIYYSHLFSVIPILIIAGVIFWKGRSFLINRLFFATAILFAVWTLCNLVLWATEFPKYTMFFWSLINLVEPFIYFFAFYFVYVFLYQSDIPLKKKILVTLPLLPTLFLASTHFSLLGFDLSNCDRAATEGILTFYGYGVEIFYAAFIVIVSIVRLRGVTLATDRRRIILMLVGIMTFLLSFSLGNILESFTDNWYIGQYGLFGAPIFVAFLAYIIAKYQTFNIRVLGAQIMVYALGFLVLAISFVRKIQNVRIVVFFTLVFVAVIGYLLIKSVRKEVEQREKLQKLTGYLRVANEKLQSLDKLKTEFLSLAAHQLRSPLTAIRGYTSMLLDGSFGGTTGEQKEAINRVYESSTHLTKVVEDLLNVSKIESGGMKYTMAPFDMEKAAKDIATDLSITAQKKGLKLEFKTDNQPPYTVNGDMEKIRQVVLNLVDNAIKYTQQGSVTVSLAKVAGGMVRVAVTDTGMGISPDEQERLFQKFSRGEGGRLNTGGSGLGLYLAKQIVEAHGGHIGIDSPGVGKGSTFSIEFKAA